MATSVITINHVTNKIDDDHIFEPMCIVVLLTNKQTIKLLRVLATLNNYNLLIYICQ